MVDDVFVCESNSTIRYHSACLLYRGSQHAKANDESSESQTWMSHKLKRVLTHQMVHEWIVDTECKLGIILSTCKYTTY